MYTVKDIADLLNISIVTLHRWSKEHKKELDPGANDPEGTGRQYTDKDVVTLWTIKVLRDQNLSHDDIAKHLAKGDRTEPPYMPDEIPDTLTKPRTNIEVLRHEIEKRDTLIKKLTDQLTDRDKLVERLQGEINALERIIDRLWGDKGS